MADQFQFTLPSASPPPTLALPSFVTGPNDKLATPDIYTQKGQVLNSFQDIVKDIQAIMPSILQGGKAIAQWIPVISQIKNGNLDINSLVARLDSTLPGMLGSFSKVLDPQTQNTILGLTKEYGSIAVTVGNTVNLVKNTNFSNLAGIGRVVTSLSGNANAFGLSDYSNLGATIGGVLASAGRYGVGGLYQTVTGLLTDSSRLYQAATKAYPGLVANSDVASLKQYAFSLPTGVAAAISPNVAGDFASQFSRTTTLNANPSASNDGSILQDVVGAFSAVKDNWNQVKSDIGVTVAGITQATSTLGLDSRFDLSDLCTSANSDFASMVGNGVMSMPTDGKEYVLTGLYSGMDVSQALQQQFPKTVFTAV